MIYAILFLTTVVLAVIYLHIQLHLKVSSLEGHSDNRFNSASSRFSHLQDKIESTSRSLYELTDAVNSRFDNLEPKEEEPFKPGWWIAQKINQKYPGLHWFDEPVLGYKLVKFIQSEMEFK